MTHIEINDEKFIKSEFYYSLSLTSGDASILKIRCFLKTG